MVSKWVISDTNILIDLQKIGLLGNFFALPFEIHTTDFVVEELTNHAQKSAVQDLINKGYLIVDSILPEEMPRVLDLMDGNLSITDCSVWYFAKKFSWIMLTGDRKLRIRAEENGVHVGGILFALDQLVENNVIPMAYAAEKLEILRCINRRLPSDDVEVRLRQWTEIKDK